MFQTLRLILKPLDMAFGEVLDPEGTPIPHDGQSVGEVVVRTPWLTQGYVGDAEKSEAL